MSGESSQITFVEFHYNPQNFDPMNQSHFVFHFQVNLVTFTPAVYAAQLTRCGLYSIQG